MKMTIEKFLREYNLFDTMTTDDMFIYDENAEDLGILKDKLMENAGASMARIIQEHVKGLEKPDIHVLCGTGNNGGDGFVIARHLARVGGILHVYLAGTRGTIRTPEARNNWKALLNMDVTVACHEVKDSSMVNGIKDFITKNSIIIDALLGSGIKGKIREPIASLISLINDLKEEMSIPVFSVDVPSGMDPNTGALAEKHVVATRTATFHKMKPGLLKRGDIAGKVHVEPIGIPPEVEWVVGKGDVKLLLKKKRDPNSTKGMNGKIAIIGGSQNYSGAPALAALAATQCGIDLVNVFAPKSVSQAIRSFSPDLIVTSLEGDAIGEKNVESLQSCIEWADTILVGPGLGRADESFRTVNGVYKLALEKNKRLIIDADGLKALQNDISIIDNPNVILTPHAGEFSIMSHVPIAELDSLEKKLVAAGEFVKKCNCSVILKGPEDIVINQRHCKVNNTGTPAMTVGGTGDVLAGITAAFASLYGINEEKMFVAACAAAHVNGLIGELTKQQHGGPFITASTMIENIPDVLSSFL